MIGAIVANIVLCSVLVWLFNVLIDQPSAVEIVPPEGAVATDTPTATETLPPVETTTPTIAPIPSATFTEVLPSPLPTLTPEPTRREIFERTRAPYVFPTPIYIPPVPPARPTPTRSR
ncbi:MAG: hypothetical protein L0Y55_10750 [Anaerolineales bacterium]|nr:hypothetical protein [Anaerolineales bacterium]